MLTLLYKTYFSTFVSINYKLTWKKILIGI